MIEEQEQLTLLAREVIGGWVQQPEGQRAGCGAVFTETATDSFAPQVAAGIPGVRPDIPLMGMFGAGGQA